MPQKFGKGCFSYTYRSAPAAAWKLVALFPRNKRRCSSFFQKCHTVCSNKKLLLAVKNGGSDKLNQNTRQNTRHAPLCT